MLTETDSIKTNGGTFRTILGYKCFSGSYFYTKQPMQKCGTGFITYTVKWYISNN